MWSTCFICGEERDHFEKQGEGFERHVKLDHNMWSYLFMVIYLREKDPTEHNGWEQYVFRLMRKEILSFFPSGNAIVLKEFKERERAEAASVETELRELRRLTEGLQHSQQKLEAKLQQQLAVEERQMLMQSVAASPLCTRAAAASLLLMALLHRGVVGAGRYP